MQASDVVRLLQNHKFNLEDEKKLQAELHSIFLNVYDKEQVEREYRLDDKNIPDFLLFGSIVVEIKVKSSGNKRKIYKQCVRYCGFEKTKELVLITNVNMGFPEQINNKNCYVLNLGRAWL